MYSTASALWHRHTGLKCSNNANIEHEQVTVKQ